MLIHSWFKLNKLINFSFQIKPQMELKIKWSCLNFFMQFHIACSHKCTSDHSFSSAEAAWDIGERKYCGEGK